MNKDDIIEALKEYFVIQELVGKATYKRYGEDSWQFLNKDALYCLLIIREGINRPCTINNWHIGGKYQQRGLRTNVQQLFRGFFTRRKLYLSGHVLGCAFDLTFKGVDANEVRRWIVNNSELFPCKIRLERMLNSRFISWVHIDTKHLKRNPKVYLFDI